MRRLMAVSRTKGLPQRRRTQDRLCPAPARWERILRWNVRRRCVFLPMHHPQVTRRRQPDFLCRDRSEPRIRGARLPEKHTGKGNGDCNGTLVPSGTLSHGIGGTGSTPQAQVPIPASLDSPEPGRDSDAIERDCQLSPLPDDHEPPVSVRFETHTPAGNPYLSHWQTRR